jgi:hypothetical protein
MVVTFVFLLTKNSFCQWNFIKEECVAQIFCILIYYNSIVLVKVHVCENFFFVAMLIDLHLPLKVSPDLLYKHITDYTITLV